MRNFHKLGRSILAMMLCVSMVFGMSATGLAAVIADAKPWEETPEGTINYVSFGDSMTNGYGLPGYDSNTGVVDYADKSYANQFAEWLDAMVDGDVNHYQLAMSAMRPEDLHWLLELDYTNEEELKLLDREPTEDGIYYRCGNHSGVAYEDIVYCHGCKWDHMYDTHVDDYPVWWNYAYEGMWYDMYDAGDYWTWDELTDGYRVNTAAAYIKAYVEDDAQMMQNLKNDPSYEVYPDSEAARIVAKYYQDATKQADVISLALGNGNFGVWLMGRITAAIMEHDGIGRNSVYKVENVLAKCKPEQREMISEVVVALDPYIDQYIGVMMGSLSAEKMASIKSVAIYAVVSFMVNYAGTVERILELNPDVDIIMLSLMNTYAGDDVNAKPGETTIGQILDVIFPPLNAFIAALPTYMQANENPFYSEANFYYAEQYTIECLIHTFGDDDFYAWNGVSRDRFIAGLVGECDHNTKCTDVTTCNDWDAGLFWELLEGFEMGGITVQRVSKQDVAEYYLLNDAERAAYAIADQDKAASIAIYLAIEDAVIKSGKEAPVTLSTLTGLNMGDPALLSTALNNFNTMLAQDISAYYETATKVLNDHGVADPTDTEINDISMVLAVPTTLSNALWTDPTLCSMLAVVARNKLGNGLGAHPSVKGHTDICNAVISAYENKTTGMDVLGPQAMEIVAALLESSVEETINSNPMFTDATHGEYEIKDNSYYVSIGDVGVTGSGSYTEKFASEIGLDLDTQFIQLGQSGLRAQDILYILDENYIPDEFALKYITANMTKFGGGLDNYRQTYIESIAKADLISVGIGVNNMTDFVMAQLNKMMMGAAPYEMDWTLLVGEENAVKVEEALVDLRADLVAQGLPETTNLLGKEMNMVDLLTFSAECLMYAYAGHALTYTKVVKAIQTINPDAHVILVDGFNPVSGVELVLDETSENAIPLGEYFDIPVKLAGYEALLYATLNASNTTFVVTPDVETSLDAMIANGEIQANTATYIYAFLQASDLLSASENGHEYIKDQILKAMTISVHVCSLVYNEEVPATCFVDGMEAYGVCECGKIYDADGKPVASLDELVIKATGVHIFKNYVSNNDATCYMDGTKSAQCDHGCGKVNTMTDIGSKLTHTYTNYVSNNNATCTADGTKTASCDHGCGKTDTVTEAGTKLNHSYTNYVSNNDATCDADGTKTASCDLGCGSTDTVADAGSKLTHSYSNYVSNNDATCTADGTKTAACDKGCGATDTVADEGTMLAHSFTEYKVETEATCTEEGVEVAVCDNCEATDSRAIAAVGHTQGKFDVVTKATVENRGLLGYFCGECDSYYETEDEVEYRLGDVNADGSIGLKDVVLMIQYRSGMEINSSIDMTIFELSSDIDANNSVDIKDIVYVVRNVAGYADCPLA